MLTWRVADAQASARRDHPDVDRLNEPEALSRGQERRGLQLAAAVSRRASGRAARSKNSEPVARSKIGWAKASMRRSLSAELIRPAHSMRSRRSLSTLAALGDVGADRARLDRMPVAVRQREGHGDVRARLAVPEQDRLVVDRLALGRRAAVGGEQLLGDARPGTGRRTCARRASSGCIPTTRPDSRWPSRSEPSRSLTATIDGVLSMIARMRRSLCPSARAASHALGHVVADARPASLRSRRSRRSHGPGRAGRAPRRRPARSAPRTRTTRAHRPRARCWPTPARDHRGEGVTTKPSAVPANSPGSNP